MNKDRIPLDEIFLRMADQLSTRSTCRRLAVGTVITNLDMTNVLGIGYNGNAKGFKNDCDTDIPGQCGCIHSETNALVKAPGNQAKLAFITHSPCVACAKLLVQSDIKTVYYRELYRSDEGLQVLAQAGIFTIISPREAYAQYGLY